MRDISKHIETAKKHLAKHPNYELSVKELQELKIRNDTEGHGDIFNLIGEAFYLGFECGRRYQKNTRG